MKTHSAKPPRCRFCGALIGKRTIAIHFLASESDRRRTATTEANYYLRHWHADELPGDVDAVRKIFPDLEIMTVRDHPSGFGVGIAFAWDGHSYRDAYFCNQSHAREFGYAAALAGHASEAWRKANA